MSLHPELPEDPKARPVRHCYYCQRVLVPGSIYPECYYCEACDMTFTPKFFEGGDLQ